MSRTDRIKWAGAGPPVQKEAGIGLSENIESVEEISGSGGIFFSVKPPSDVACRPLI